MSRTDANEIDLAGGFHQASMYRSSGDREAEIAALISLNHDRGGSQGPSRYSGLSPGLGGQMRGLVPSEREYGSGSNSDLLGPNRNNSFHVPSPSISAFSPHPHLVQHPPSPLSRSPTSTEQGTLYQSPPLADRDTHPRRSLSATLPPTNPYLSCSTLLWGNFEPWMDEEYAKQVCKLLNWEPIQIKVPQPPPDPATGQQANNPGYCFLTFSTPAQAATVLAQVNNSGKGGTMTMPNSSKPFVLNWAPAVTPSISTPVPPAMTAYSNNSQQYQKEYSIFVGDLAPETSNSDLVAVFRNPVLGLRNDREPKFIRPFLSCKSAKIMLDPLTGVSRGYGFVRFSDEADQQRALIEMHGLYCLSRPMRISPATAKFKPASGVSLDYSQAPPFSAPLPNVDNQPVTVAVPLPAAPQAKSVSAPIAATGSNNSLGSNSVQGSSSNSSLGGSSSGASLSSNAASGGLSGNDVKVGNGLGVSGLLSEAQLRQVFGQTDGYLMTEESLKHHAHARAILGNLMGPNGEQLTSNDPYNTTVFVGGLSPLISEETLRTFFAPFGDIHYVKVPVGKHCGFVQFVRKADAERAIEKMQGFPIGGSRIRLSWGRSQYKAAQAAAQAAQAAALQAQYNTQMTPEQALQLMYQLSQQGYITGSATNDGNSNNANSASDTFGANIPSSLPPDVRLNLGRDTHQNMETFASNAYQPRVDVHRMLSNFSPFSPDPDSFVDEAKSRDPSVHVQHETFSHPPRTFVPGFRLQDVQNADSGRTNRKPSPPGPSPNASRYGSYFDMQDRAISRPEPSSRLPGRVETDHHDLEDLNGTLASLDLDRPWKSPEARGSMSNARHHIIRATSPN